MTFYRAPCKTGSEGPEHLANVAESVGWDYAEALAQQSETAELQLFSLLLHFKEQPQLEQLGLNCRGECFRELCWLSQISVWNLATVSNAQTQPSNCASVQ